MEAYVQEQSIYGVAFPTDDFIARFPTSQDVNGWPHVLTGGKTAVKLADEKSFLLNRTSEYVILGGKSMPSGSFLFQLGERGEWIIIREW